MKRVLFLCTSNHYRSRFAAILFTELARRRQLDWLGESRGIAAGQGLQRAGPISMDVVKGLQARGITVADEARQPLPLQEQDLLQADLIIAPDEAEHRPLLRVVFPAWENKVEYWHVHDLHLTPAEQALPELESGIRKLIDRLAGMQKSKR